jgi:predicted branched-subunit amino acid permease
VSTTEQAQASAARQGARTALPYMLALAPYGVIVGALVDQSHVARAPGWASAVLLYGGSAQVIALQLLGSGATVAVIIATIALLNVRLVAYSTAIAPRWRNAPRWWIALASYVLIDPAYVIAEQRWETETDPTSHERLAWHRRYYMGAAATIWAIWVAACGIGTFAGSTFASAIPVSVVVQLMFVTMTVTLARQSTSIQAAVLGFGFGIVANPLPEQLGPLVAAGAAVAVVCIVHRGPR